ncbi:hypothetical protein QFC19_001271 [Naganishia cerealis]|uniref:Uncharacterized protein n=1 Tax=Naganishia cerealis TaxID=610337 RepID=A0ACC2WHX4_9TREE|nr:hypothetical protein QFC19_001271 [Naganishia cerealis]
MSRPRSTSTSTVPQASLPRMIMSPFIRTFRILRLPLPANLPTSPKALLTPLVVHVVSALKRLDRSLDPRKTLAKLSKHEFTIWNTVVWSVLYGANISDILTRYTHPVLDILAWLPYGVMHFVIPFVLAAVLWVFGPKGAVQYFGKAFGFMNLFGVLVQLFFPCAAPWYEIIHGLTPADYSMSGSPGGLMRIDRLFGSTGYTNAFGGAPLVFGAFPSLHAGTSTIEALFLTYFFPKFAPFYWAYAGTLYWATMYLTHHYLVDVVGGGCLALGCFYYFMPKQFKDLDTGIVWDAQNESTTPRRAEDYELVDEDDAFDQAMDIAGNSLGYHISSSTAASSQSLKRVEEGEVSVTTGQSDSRVRPSITPNPYKSSADVNSTLRPEENQNRQRSVSWSEAHMVDGMRLNETGKQRVD